MERNKVLIVDDEPAIRELLAQILSSRFQIYFAKNGAEALQIAREVLPTIIVLDVLMPGKTGIEVCSELRNDPATAGIPIVMLTALNEPEQRTSAFTSGADDYVVKPFFPEELLARVESKIRRLQEVKPVVPGLTFGDIKLDFEDLKVTVGPAEIEMGQIEFRILTCLVRNQGQLVKREKLNEYVWGADAPSERALDPHITTLRRKIQDFRGELKTVYGQGYSLVIREK